MKFKAQLNWYGEIHILYAVAMSEKQAKYFCFIQLAEKLRVSFESVKSYFLGKSRYSIRRVE